MMKDYALIPTPTPASEIKPGSLIDLAGSVAFVSNVRQLAKGYIRLVITYNGETARAEYLPTTTLAVLTNPEF
jgi:hypothetical protein